MVIYYKINNKNTNLKNNLDVNCENHINYLLIFHLHLNITLNIINK